MAGYKGWDFFTSDPGTVEVMCCRVCGEKCKVRRNVMGPTGFVESTGGGSHLHDVFTCKFVQEKWHQQVRFLKQEQRATRSPSLWRLLQGDVDAIMKERKPILCEKTNGQEPSATNDT